MNNNIKRLSYVAIFATIIYLGTSFINIKLMPSMMIHIGNALVIIAFFALKRNYAMLATSIAFGLYDILNGYASAVVFTILESIIVLVAVDIVFKVLQEKFTTKNVIIISITAAITKIIIIFLKRIITNYIVLGQFQLALAASLAKMPNSYATGLITAIAVPLIYATLKPYIFSIRESF